MFPLALAFGQLYNQPRHPNALLYHIPDPTCADTSSYAGSPSLLFVLRVMTLVMACLMVTPAFSMSFLDSPDVTHTLIAGTTV